MNDLDKIVEMLKNIQWQLTSWSMMAGFLFGVELCKLFVAYKKWKNDER